MAIKSWKNTTNEAQALPSLQTDEGGTVVVEPGDTFETDADLSNLAAFEEVKTKATTQTSKTKKTEDN